MKTAEEWAKEIKPGAEQRIDLGNGQTVTGPGLFAKSVDPFSILEIIRAAQRDAIEAAVEKAKWAVWHKCMVENPVCVCEVNDYPAPCGNSYEEMLDAIRSLLLAP